MNNPKKTVNASPSKSFFVDMLTKDISAIDCVLDLIDNAVDSYITSTEYDVMQQLTHGNTQPVDGKKTKIKVALSPNAIEISDTCGGIPVEVAQLYAFRFGRPVSYPDNLLHSNRLGVYGIGMKRAFFKLGK